MYLFHITTDLDQREIALEVDYT